MKDKLALIGALILVIGTCFGVYFYFEARYAHAGDFTKVMETIRKVEQRLDGKILNDDLREVRREINEIEDAYCKDKSKPCTEEKMPELVRKRYRELKCDREKLEAERKELKK